MTSFINLYAGPGAGKSTLAAGVFHELKMLGYNAELVPEFAKDLVWEGRHATLSNQVYVNARQFHMIKRLASDNGPEFIVTDSPVLLGIAYGPDLPFYHDLVKWCHKQVSTPELDFLVMRDASKFQQEGRVHDLDQSRTLDTTIQRTLEAVNPRYVAVTGKSRRAVDVVVQQVIEYRKRHT